MSEEQERVRSSADDRRSGSGSDSRRSSRDSEGGRGRGGRGRDRDGGRRGGRFRRSRRKVCAFCVDRVERIDYKDHQRLREFVSDRGKILKSRMTGTCSRHQRMLSVAVKRARHMALLPFVSE